MHPFSIRSSFAACSRSSAALFLLPAHARAPLTLEPRLGFFAVLQAANVAADFLCHMTCIHCGGLAFVVGDAFDTNTLIGAAQLMLHVFTFIVPFLAPLFLFFSSH